MSLAGIFALLCAVQARIGALPKNNTRLCDASDPKFHVGLVPLFFVM